MENPTYRELQRLATRKLQRAGCESAHFTAMNLMTHCFGLERADLILKKEERPAEDTVKSFMALVNRCASGEPLQYILGEWEFMGLPFSVGPGVLIPRPETELLVDCALRLLRRRTKKQAVIYDLCTGSGAIAVSLASFWPQAEIYALEVSREAMDYAVKNTERNGAAAVRLKLWDILQGPEGCGLPRPDLIVSNPPYIGSDEIPRLQREVQLEPRLALDGGKDGLRFYRAIRDLWLPMLAPHGAAVLECGNDQGEALCRLFEGRFAQSGIRQDYSGLDRIFWGTLPDDMCEVEKKNRSEA